jgi:hypothetical protein
MVENKEKDKPVISELNTIKDFGHIRVVFNMFELDDFDQLKRILNSDVSTSLETIQLFSNAKPQDIPLFIKTTHPPENDLDDDSLTLSYAELAGATAAIKILTGSNPIIIDYEKIFQNEQGNAAAYSTSDLLKRHDISIRKQEGVLSAKLGALRVSFEDKLKVSSEDDTVSRKNLHLLIGFSKFYSLFTFSNSSVIPKLSLVDKPLTPHSNLEGNIPGDKIMNLDRIESYI